MKKELLFTHNKVRIFGDGTYQYDHWEDDVFAEFEICGKMFKYKHRGSSWLETDGDETMTPQCIAEIGQKLHEAYFYMMEKAFNLGE
jgi:hypothetical protein